MNLNQQVKEIKTLKHHRIQRILHSKCPWGNYSPHVSETNVSIVYEQVVYWKKNLFLLQSGKTGKQFVDETTKLMKEWLQDSPLKDIA